MEAIFIQKRARISSDDLPTEATINDLLGSQSSNNIFLINNDQTDNKDNRTKQNHPQEFQSFPFISIKNVSDFHKKATLAKFSKIQDRSSLVPSKVAPKKKRSVVQKNTIRKYLQVT